MAVNPTLLIVDDEPDVADIFKILVEDSFDCTVCTDSRQALELVAATTYDVVVTDLKMPEVSGDAVLKATKEHSPSTRVFISSGHSLDDPSVQDAVNLGADGVITKPYTDIDQILAVLQGAEPSKKLNLDSA